MNLRLSTSLVLVCAFILVTTGCKDAPGNPRLVPDAARPDQLLDFATLYKQNCAACHGEHGRNGASISLANPVYLAVAGESTIEHVIAAGVPGTLMPAFSKTAGGMLTDKQIAALGHGMIENWEGQNWGKQNWEGQGDPNAPSPPPYAATLQSDSARGQKSFLIFCASCHGENGAGTPAHSGSIVNSSYLALVNDQYLRSTVIAGLPESGMPDWRSDLTGADSRPTTDQEITDTVAWLATHRTATPGQPYQPQQATSGAKHE